MASGAPLPVDERTRSAQRGVGRSSAFARVAKYTLVRLLALIATVVIGVYLTVIIANMGGHVDEIRKAQIQEGIAAVFLNDPDIAQMPLDQRRELEAEMIRLEEERLGLDTPFLIRSFRYLWSALSLDLGRSERLTSDTGSRNVRMIILERLPPTLLLFATAEILLFFFAIFIALFLSRRYGSKLDRLMLTLAPTSAAPSWFYGILLILVFSAVLGWFPFSGMVQAPPPDSPIRYALSVMRHLALPVMSIVISAVFLTIYSWRTFFLIYSSEDYVEMAKAKGLSSGAIERRYILRPTLPTIITSFALTLISLWMGAIVLESIFVWPGLGRLLYEAIGSYDTPVVVGSVVIYAYLLGLTVFVLDIVYALIDPRVKVGGDGAKS